MIKSDNEGGLDPKLSLREMEGQGFRGQKNEWYDIWTLPNKRLHSWLKGETTYPKMGSNFIETLFQKRRLKMCCLKAALASLMGRTHVFVQHLGCILFFNLRFWNEISMDLNYFGRPKVIHIPVKYKNLWHSITSNYGGLRPRIWSHVTQECCDLMPQQTVVASGTAVINGLTSPYIPYWICDLLKVVAFDYK